MIGQLQRPRLLVRAARAGVEEYRRERHLPRLLSTMEAPRSGEAVMQLMQMEAEEDGRRRAGAAEYSIPAHVNLLIAIMGEARLLRLAGRDEPAGGATVTRLPAAPA